MKHCVYILKSRSTLRTYVGYTTDIKRRLRQHNGEIKGGAKYTRYGRPWECICYVIGFPDKRSAYQFEWRMHHPKRKWGKRNGINNRLKILRKVLEMEYPTSKSISQYSYVRLVVWINKDYM